MFPKAVMASRDYNDCADTDNRPNGTISAGGYDAGRQ